MSPSPTLSTALLRLSDSGEVLFRESCGGGTAADSCCVIKGEILFHTTIGTQKLCSKLPHPRRERSVLIKGVAAFQG